MKPLKWIFYIKRRSLIPNIVRHLAELSRIYPFRAKVLPCKTSDNHSYSIYSTHAECCYRLVVTCSVLENGAAPKLIFKQNVRKISPSTSLLKHMDLMSKLYGRAYGISTVKLKQGATGVEPLFFGCVKMSWILSGQCPNLPCCPMGSVEHERRCVLMTSQQLVQGHLQWERQSSLLIYLWKISGGSSSKILKYYRIHLVSSR